MSSLRRRVEIQHRFRSTVDRDSTNSMRRTNHPIELDLCSIKGNGHVVIYSIIPAIAAIIGIGRIPTATASTVSPTITNIVELVGASALDAIIDCCYVEHDRGRS